MPFNRKSGPPTNTGSSLETSRLQRKLQHQCRPPLSHGSHGFQLGSVQIVAPAPPARTVSNLEKFRPLRLLRNHDNRISAMTDSFRLRLVMTCADNTSAVQHEKRACRVKCTLYIKGQEATKTDGTTLTESRRKNDLRTAWIYPRPSGSTAPHGERFRSIPHGVVGVILPLPLDVRRAPSN